MELWDLLSDRDFRRRPERTQSGLQNSGDAFVRLAGVLFWDAKTVLQELVKVAVEFCGADASGISMEECVDGQLRFRWVAIAGTFSEYLNGTTPRFFSPCGTTLARGRPQLYRVDQRYYDWLGISAPPIRDGMLIPWQVENTRGTIWAVSHGSPQTFDYRDYQLLDSIAQFVALAIQRQNAVRQQQEIAAYAELVNQLAHELNNPLQGATGALYLAEHDDNSERYVKMAAHELQRVSEIVSRLVSLRAAA